MKTKFKWLFVALAGLVGLFTSGLFFALRSGNSAFNDSDLRVVRMEVPVAENAFAALTNAATLLHWPEKMPPPLSDALDHKSWDPTFMDSFLATNAAALELWKEAVSFPRLQVPQPLDLGENYAYLSRWGSLGQLATLTAQDLSRRGQDREAFALVLQVVKFGHSIEECGGLHIHYLVGSATKIMGLKSLSRLAPKTRLSPLELDDCVRRLDSFTANGAGFTNSVKQGYTLQSTWMRQMIATNASTRLALNPDKTDRLNAQSSRLILALFEKPYADDSLRKVIAGSTNRSSFRQLLRGNVVGNTLHDMSLPFQNHFLSGKSQENIWVRATQVLLACKSFQIRNGRLPSTLQELVPDNLPAIPLDDFDGKPLRYSASNKLIYSVAKDLIDSKGTNFNAAGERLDIPFKIEF